VKPEAACDDRSTISDEPGVLLLLIADYGAGDLAFAEVQQRLALDVPDARVVPVAVAPFDTLAAGFCVAQLALTEGPSNRLVVHNVAPRRDEPGPRRDNEGEQFVALRTYGDILVVGPNAGHALSFVAPRAREAHVLNVPAAGSQFRSRDFLPTAIDDLLHDRDVARLCPFDLSAVPPPPEGVLAYVDGFGNLKTTWTRAPAAVGQPVTVTIGQATATAIVGDGTFAVAEGELSFAPGSSGWLTAGDRRLQFYELMLRGDSAAARFDHPSTGMAVDVRPAGGGQAGEQSRWTDERG
jgi:S-adenosylmethionine hydrolase